MTAAAALSVEGLSVEFRTRSGIVRALENVSFSVAKGETVALVGKSGSGKSVTAYAVMGILDPAGRVAAGRAMLGDLDLLSATPKQLAQVRGRKIGMIFQNPRTALNPIRPVGRQIADVLIRHGNVSRRAAPGARSGNAARRRHHRPGASGQSLSVRNVGRHVPARHDRDRAGGKAVAIDRRRADYGARRHHASRDHGS